MLNFTKESILVCLFYLKSNDSKYAKTSAIIDYVLDKLVNVNIRLIESF